RPPLSTPFPYTTLFRSPRVGVLGGIGLFLGESAFQVVALGRGLGEGTPPAAVLGRRDGVPGPHERAARGVEGLHVAPNAVLGARDRKSTRLNSSHVSIS